VDPHRFRHQHTPCFRSVFCFLLTLVVSQRVQYQHDIRLHSRTGWFVFQTISCFFQRGHNRPFLRITAKPSTISTGQLQTLLPFHLPPIKLVVSQRSYDLLDLGYLILRPVSHLDAFSGYPFRRSLLGYAVGTTTDTRALRPPRSSRTRGSSSQIPNAHSG
jgi:hypothetical protein